MSFFISMNLLALLEVFGVVQFVSGNQRMLLKKLNLFIWMVEIAKPMEPDQQNSLIMMVFVSRVSKRSRDLYHLNIGTTYEPRHDKTNTMSVRPVWSESSLSAWRNIGSLATHWAHSEDSDQTGHMHNEDSDQIGHRPRLIWVFAGRTLILLVLSCRAIYILSSEINSMKHNGNKTIIYFLFSGYYR